MKRTMIALFLLVPFLLGQPPAARGVESPAPVFPGLDAVFGQTGKVIPPDVQKYSWPRGDLRVTLNGITIQPALALTSWAGFLRDGMPGDAATMGDLVLLPVEVDPVIRELQAGGFEIMAVHNHLNGETPEVVYVHFMGKGPAETLGKTLKGALAKTRTPPPTGRPPAKPAAGEQAVFDTIQSVLGEKGSLAGSVLQVNVPRKEEIEESGSEMPPAMGMANSMNFQVAGTRVAATGDFVLIADEVNPVIRELEGHGIRVTALHTHMLHDSPHIFFMHFWALGMAQDVAQGLKAALSKVNVKPAQ